LGRTRVKNQLKNWRGKGKTGEFFFKSGDFWAISSMEKSLELLGI
jgi:hypothetical protein